MQHGPVGHQGGHPFFQGRRPDSHQAPITSLDTRPSPAGGTWVTCFIKSPRWDLAGIYFFKIHFNVKTTRSRDRLVVGRHVTYLNGMNLIFFLKNRTADESAIKIFRRPRWPGICKWGQNARRPIQIETQGKQANEPKSCSSHKHTRLTHRQSQSLPAAINFNFNSFKLEKNFIKLWSFKLQKKK